MRARITAHDLPPWLTFRGDDWFGVSVVVDGQDITPPLAMPNALFFAAIYLRNPNGRRA